MDNAADAVPIAVLLDERRHLMDVAHWMLGSAESAESVVDETYRRWFALSDAERARRQAPLPWLVRVAGSICLARPAPRGHADGGRPLRDTGCPRPGPPEAAGGPPDEGISEVLRDAPDALSPAERAAFVLNDVFVMTQGAVADIVGRTQPECEALADRARRSVRDGTTPATAPRVYAALVRQVLHACLTEDTGLLESLLAPDAAAFFDGGGKVRALVRPVHGRGQVAYSLLGLLARRPRTTLAPHPVNGRTGLVVRHDGLVAAVISLDVADRCVTQVWAVLNPDKLRSWNRRPGPPPSGPGAHRGP